MDEIDKSFQRFIDEERKKDPVDENSKEKLFSYATTGNVQEFESFIHDLERNKHIDMSKIVNTKNDTGRSLLYVAVRCEQPNIVKVLLNKKETYLNTMNMSKSDYETPLNYAIRKGLVDMLTILMEDKRINLKNDSGKGGTVLHTAIRYLEHSKEFERTLEVCKGCPIDIALDYLLRREDIRELLYRTDEDGMTAEKLAHSYGFNYIAEKFKDVERPVQNFRKVFNTSKKA